MKEPQAFLEYCLLEDRSLAKLAQKLGKPSGYTRQLETWSSSHRWVERVRQYDQERAKEKQRKHDSEIQAMDERHAQIGINLQLKGIKQLEELLKSGSVNASEAIRMVKQGMDAERVARGAPTERTEQTVNTSGVAVYLPQKQPIQEGGDANAKNDE